MTKPPSKPGLPISFPIDIPTTWSPEQASAVFDLLSEIRDRIWDKYNVQIQTELQHGIAPHEEAGKSDLGDYPFPILGTE